MKNTILFNIIKTMLIIKYIDVLRELKSTYKFVYI